ncbi:UNKNOWN [Stylonychia lemnae]|uniref:Protein kinase domain-containing protein n=1 Tax=Stylonychia lemnae TaxID=5949 RepID=A0A078A7M2_STYLE|nr:UNKNOWN [Stylonychia lemnae]|eukprot:CDW77861.1 UNKNOWN [Stylonychia lemnae]
MFQVQLGHIDSHFPEIVKEIFILDGKSQEIRCYIVLQIIPGYNLKWMFEEKITNLNRETKLRVTPSETIFTQEKYLYLFYLAIEYIYNIELNQIYHGNLSETCILIKDDFEIVVDGYDLSIIYNPQQDNLKYHLKGLNQTNTPQQAIGQIFNNSFAFKFEQASSLAPISRILHLQHNYRQQELSKVDKELYFIENDINKNPEYLTNYWMGRYYEVKAKRAYEMKFDSAIDDFKIAKSLCKNQITMRDMLRLTAKIHIYNNRTKNALNDMFKELFINKTQFGDLSLEVIQNYFNISKYYLKQNDGGEADLYFQQIVAILKQRVKLLKNSKTFQSLEEKDDFIIDYYTLFEDQGKLFDEIFNLMIGHKDYIMAKNLMSDVIQIKDFLIEQGEQDDDQKLEQDRYQIGLFKLRLSTALYHLQEIDQSYNTLIESSENILLTDENSELMIQFTLIKAKNYYFQALIQHDWFDLQEAQSLLNQVLYTLENLNWQMEEVLLIQIDSYDLLGKIAENQQSYKVMQENLELKMQKQMILYAKNQFCQQVLNTYLQIADCYSLNKDFHKSIKLLRSLIKFNVIIHQQSKHPGKLLNYDLEDTIYEKIVINFDHLKEYHKAIKVLDSQLASERLKGRYDHNIDKVIKLNFKKVEFKVKLDDYDDAYDILYGLIDYVENEEDFQLERIRIQIELGDLMELEKQYSDAYHQYKITLKELSEITATVNNKKQIEALKKDLKSKLRI